MPMSYFIHKIALGVHVDRKLSDQGSGSIPAVQEVANRLAQSISSRDLPPGSKLCPAMLSFLLQQDKSEVEAGFVLLRQEGLVELTVDGWEVSRSSSTLPREVILRAAPTLIAIARFAASNGGPRAASELRNIYTIYRGIDGDGEVPTRAKAYEDFFTLLGELSGSIFLRRILDQLFGESIDIRYQIAKTEAEIGLRPEMDSELFRLIQAIAEQDCDSAGQAMDDHMLLLLHRFDRHG